ncbi:mechanosensitive ion channel family protein [Leptolyngbya iicbica]|uniref:Mechanosensitive ion channel family protein n=2 Tax=Cyanophyceae TaxID=3028117 RepID=A0A4Q7E701_9CYAN|nr:mechanosensitive ion channel family protein [Leptolyngbya sp. LK]RZM77839.1 mechanosensitive ion channel family protein [Leptolyngbya sp. LK]
MDINVILTSVTDIIVAFGLKIIGAIIFWFVGRWLIGLAIKMISAAFRSSNLEETLLIYLKSTLGVLLNVILVVAILGFFGIETTSFAAFLAAAGIAIGAAWSGLLAHFAAGAFLVIFRPYKVGDFITAGGITGTVREIGLFVTSIDTLENVRNVVGNNVLFSDTIQNFSTNPYRRVDLVAQLNHDVNHKHAIALLKEKVSAIPNVMAEPAPDVEILEFTPMGPVLAVRPYCNNDHYWQVYFDTNKVIRETCVEANFSAPEQHLVVHRTAA